MSSPMDAIKSSYLSVRRKLSRDDSAFDNGRYVLITAGSGYISSWIVRQFLSNGYKVRVAVQSKVQAQDLRDTFREHEHNLEPCMVLKQNWREAVKTVDGVVVTGLESDACIEVLNAIVEEGSNVSRVVVTTKVLDNVPNGYNGHTEKNGSPLSIEDAVHDFLHGKSPKFRIATIALARVWGPLAHKTDLKTVENSELGGIYSVMSPQGAKTRTNLSVLFIDVRNAAQAHLRAYEREDVDGRDKDIKNYIVAQGPVTYYQVRSTLAHHYPARVLSFPNNNDYEDDEAPPQEIDTTPIKESLCMSFIGLSDCLRATGQSLLEVEEADKKGVRYDGQEWFRHV